LFLSRIILGRMLEIGRFERRFSGDFQKRAGYFSELEHGFSGREC